MKAIQNKGVGGAELTFDAVWHVLVAVMVSTSAGALPIHFGSRRPGVYPTPGSYPFCNTDNDNTSVYDCCMYCVHR